MDSFSVSKPGWILTEESFAKLLARLSPDAELAGEHYEKLRLMLMKFFDWRGAHFPEECADETLNRVARKIDSGEAIRDMTAYCHSVARFVFLETLRHPDNNNVRLGELASTVALDSETEERDAQRHCFENCLQELPDDSHRLILEYYKDEKRGKIDNRLAMAEELGIPLNALRSRAQRARNKLEECVKHCLPTRF